MDNIERNMSNCSTSTPFSIDDILKDKKDDEPKTEVPAMVTRIPMMHSIGCLYQRGPLPNGPADIASTSYSRFLYANDIDMDCALSLDSPSQPGPSSSSLGSRSKMLEPAGKITLYLWSYISNSRIDFWFYNNLFKT